MCVMSLQLGVALGINRFFTKKKLPTYVHTCTLSSTSPPSRQVWGPSAQNRAGVQKVKALRGCVCKR